MIKKIFIVFLLFAFTGCITSSENMRLGISFGVDFNKIEDEETRDRVGELLKSHDNNLKMNDLLEKENTLLKYKDKNNKLVLDSLDPDREKKVKEADNKRFLIGFFTGEGTAIITFLSIFIPVMKYIKK